MTEILLWESKNGRWAIWKYLNRNRRVHIMVTDDKTGYTDYPKFTNSYLIPLYLNPEKIPQYVRFEVAKIMAKMEKAGTLGEYIAEEKEEVLV